MGAILDRISEEQKDAAKRVDLLALAERYGPMRRNAHHDWQGTCPKCGADFFHVYQMQGGEWRWRCYECHEQPADGIELVRWQQPGLSFPEAVAQLTGGTWPKAATRRPPEQRQAPATKAQPANWRKKAERIAAEAHERLWAAEGEPAQAYLLGRGLEPHIWLQYGLGYRSDTLVPGTKGQRAAPAIVMPWRTRADTAPYALRYRFFEPQDGHKLTAEIGSQFAVKLYGGHGLPEWVSLPAPEGEQLGVQRLCTLLIVEGELNAMSCWQVASETHLHVLSLGSEGQQIPPAALAMIKRYGQVLVWADREKIAQGLIGTLPGAKGIHSPGGKDANDLLKVGLLGGFLATMRANNAKSQGELEGLLWVLYDAARLPAGIDTGSAKILQRLAAQLGKQAVIYEAEPNRWITER